MALAALATVADLSARGVDVSNAELAGLMLDVASAAVRDAAGCPITEVTSTVQLAAPDAPWLALPAGPVTDVSTVLVDGVEVTDWRLVAGALYRPCGWRLWEPAVVTVTYTHGLPAAPADVVDLVCSLAAAGIAAAADGYVARTGGSPQSEAIDDYRVTYAQPADLSAGPMELPPATRAWLRSRFAGSAHVVGLR